MLALHEKLAAMITLTLQEVTKTFGATPAVDKVDLLFPANKTSAIIGRSGCGKSTLLKLINGLEVPDSGCVLVNHQPLDYDHIVTTRRQMGYAVQGTGLFPHLTVRDNILLLADLTDSVGLQHMTRVKDLLDFVHLEESILSKYPHEISGGQQQRVGLCRALVLDPPILLLDEAFAAVDPITRLDIHQQFSKMLEKEPRTTVMVTHDVQEVIALADHIVVMEKGQVVHQILKNQLFEGHSSPQEALLKLLQDVQPA